MQARLAPFLNSAFEGVEELDKKIELVAEMLVDAAKCFLPLVQLKRPTMWKDDTLSCQSRAHSAWSGAGCLFEGPAYDEKCTSHHKADSRESGCKEEGEVLYCSG